MEILQLVDQLEQVLNRGWRVPFTSSLVINEEECLRLIDQMRISVPSAIKESERMIAERDRIMADARSRAEAMLDQAEDEAIKMVSQHFVAQEAQREAERTIGIGREEATRLVQEAEDYALNVLRDLVSKMSTSIRQAENGIQAIEDSRSQADGAPANALAHTEDEDPIPAPQPVTPPPPPAKAASSKQAKSKKADTKPSEPAAGDSSTEQRQTSRRQIGRVAVTV